jgi:hypothetical protein
MGFAEMRSKPARRRLERCHEASETPDDCHRGLLRVGSLRHRTASACAAKRSYAIKPGDTVTIRGLNALNAPLVAAIAITNDATGNSPAALAQDLGRAARHRQ